MNPQTAHLDIADPKALVRAMIARGLVKAAPPLSETEIKRELNNVIMRRFRHKQRQRQRQRRRAPVNHPPLTPRTTHPTQ